MKNYTKYPLIIFLIGGCIFGLSLIYDDSANLEIAGPFFIFWFFLSIFCIILHFILKLSRHKRIVKSCKEECIFDEKDRVWFFKNVFGEIRKFPEQKQCLDYCINQKKEHLG